MNTTKVLEELYHAEINCDSFFKNKEGFTFNKNFNKIDRIIRLLIHKPSSVMYVDPDSFTPMKRGERLTNESQLKKDKKDILAVIEYHNCIMYKLDQNELSYDSNDEVITHTATFSYDFMTVGRW